MPVLAYRGLLPTIAQDCFIAPNAYVIGDVHLGPETSIWFGTVVRGDVYYVRIGARTNVQDNTVVHVTTGKNATLIGDDVTIGHGVILHGCTIGDRALVGMGAIVMDRAVIGAGALVAAGSLVSEGTQIPPGTLALGSPARVKRDLTDEERTHLAWSPPHYARLAADYLADLAVEPSAGTE